MDTKKMKWQEKLPPEENRKLDFKPRPSDILITTAAKCGTTWMQQIVHQLRSGGDMEFEDIGDVVPFIEQAANCKINLDDEQKYQPRCYKTHCWYHPCPKGGKHVVVYREPCAVAYSLFNFQQGWLFQPGEVSLDDFVRNMFLAGTEPPHTRLRVSYFYHMASWWPHRNDPGVLFLFYEDMKEDLESVVRAVASFIGVSDEERVKKAVEMSTFDFMKANSDKYKDKLVARYLSNACGLAPDHAPDRVATGTTTKALEVMSSELKDAIQKKWEETVGKDSGFKTYQELRRSFREQNPLPK